MVVLIVMCGFLTGLVQAQPKTGNEQFNIKDRIEKDAGIFPRRDRRDPFRIDEEAAPIKKTDPKEKGGRNDLPTIDNQNPINPTQEEARLSPEEQYRRIEEATKFLGMMPGLLGKQDFNNLRTAGNNIHVLLDATFSLPDVNLQRKVILMKAAEIQTRAKIHEEFQQKQLFIGAIIYDARGKSVAIVNDESIEIGDMIGESTDLEVLAIKRDGVVFRYRGEEVKKNLP